MKFGNTIVSVYLAAVSVSLCQQTSSDEELRAKWLSADLTQIPPPRMTIAPVQGILEMVDTGVVPAYANDGKRFAYAKRDASGRSNYLVVSDLITLRPLKEIPQVSVQGTCIFSPDDKRIFLRDPKGIHKIIDTSTWQVFDLPIDVVNGFRHSQFAYAWTDPLRVRLLVGGRDVQELDLDTLKVSIIDSSKVNVADFFKRADTHPIVRLTRFESREVPPSVLAKSIDGRIYQVLKTPHYEQYKFHPHPNCHVFISRNEKISSSFVVSYIIESSARNLHWTMKNPVAQLTADQKQQFSRYMARKVPFYANVYSPAVNPLTGRVVGPDGKSKGMVSVVEWTDTVLHLETLIEITPLKVGDIVSGLRTDQVAEFGNSAFEFKGVTELLEARDK